MKNKYMFIKRLYKGYLILFKRNGKYRTYGIDNMLLKYFKKGNISYVIVDEDFNVSVVDAENNNYYKYLLLEFFRKIINNMTKKALREGLS